MAKKNILPASAYAGRAKEGLAEYRKETPGPQTMNEMNISVGTISKRPNNAVKADGVKIRGTGAATKGVKARGPMG